MLRHSSSRIKPRWVKLFDSGKKLIGSRRPSFPTVRRCSRKCLGMLISIKPKWKTTSIANRETDAFSPHRGGAAYPKYKKTEDVHKAIAYFQKYLENKPDDLTVQWILNLAYM